MASDKKVLPGLCGVCFNAESTPRIDPNFRGANWMKFLSKMFYLDSSGFGANSAINRICQVCAL